MDGAGAQTGVPGNPVGAGTSAKAGNPVGAKTSAEAGKRGPSPAAIGVAIGLLALIAIAAALVTSGVIGANRDGGSFLSSGSSESAASSVASDPAEKDADATSSSEASSATGSSGEAAAIASSASSEPVHDGPAAGSTDHSSVFETESVRITMPASLAEKGYRWTDVSNESVILEGAGGSVIANLLWGDAATREYEAKHESYRIGIVSHGSTGFPVFLCLNYLDSEGERIHWGRSEKGTLATEYMGVSLEDMVSWIELYSDGDYRPAGLDESGTGRTGGSSDFGPSLREPFYGVWVSASKDYNKALSKVEELGNAGFDGSVLVTTDWDNLNPEPWYVVTAGCARTESEAQSLCERVRGAGYGEAYVKYSGNYIGER